ncbi:FecCD family ABC transporter permease [Microbacterium indicum]|uniref:FecCD family ABC transporter permease n=1 Tax=Microbacterium indicum TaxID=358100 RepID=UPI0004071ED0|nr:iron chelate uptake ABC transporter family permease subunit [Microbacterium indicum]
MTEKLTPPSGRLVRLGPVAIVIRPRAAIVTAVLVFVALAAGCVAMTVGTIRLSPADVIAAAFGQGEETSARIVQAIRLPRVVTALFAGAALGVSGAVFQSVSRNALGSPEIIGFTTGAATGALAQIILFDGDGAQIALGAVAGGLLTAVVVYVLSTRGGASGGYRLILVGIGVGAVLQAVNSLLLVAGDLDSAVEANLWLAGSLNMRDWGNALTVLVACALLIPVVAALARRTELMEMGDDVARQLGVRTERTRLATILAAVLLVAAATAAAGPISFVALAAPQIVSRLVGGSGLNVAGSAAMGGCLLVVADAAAQLLPGQLTIPIGRMTGVIGGAYLIWLLLRKGRVRV